MWKCGGRFLKSLRRKRRSVVWLHNSWFSSIPHQTAAGWTGWGSSGFLSSFPEKRLLILSVFQISEEVEAVGLGGVGGWGGGGDRRDVFDVTLSPVTLPPLLCRSAADPVIKRSFFFAFHCHIFPLKSLTNKSGQKGGRTTKTLFKSVFFVFYVWIYSLHPGCMIFFFHLLPHSFFFFFFDWKN